MIVAAAAVVAVVMIRWIERNEFQAAPEYSHSQRVKMKELTARARERKSFDNRNCQWLWVGNRTLFYISLRSLLSVDLEWSAFLFHTRMTISFYQYYRNFNCMRIETNARENENDSEVHYERKKRRCAAETPEQWGIESQTKWKSTHIKHA